MTPAVRRHGVPVLVLVLLLLGQAGPARADSELGVSADGSTWSFVLSGPLFDPAERWVPGDVRSSTFYVRNQASEAGTLAIEATAVDPDHLVAHDDITLDVRRDGGPWEPLPADGRPHGLVRPDLAAAAGARIEVRAGFTPASTNRSQASRLRLDLRVVLTEAAAVAGPSEPEPGGLLPDTGGVELAVLVTGGGLVLIGYAIVLGTTRIRRTEGES